MDNKRAGAQPAPELEASARRLLAGPAGEGSSSKQMAERAVDACERLARHLSRLLGEVGVRMLLDRSIRITSDTHAWLRAAVPEPGKLGDAGLLRATFEAQHADAIAEGFVLVLSTFVALLGRLIGESLVERLLREVWPSVFAQSAKDAP